MQRILAVALVAALALSACKKEAAAVENGADGGAGPDGRYHGLGIYSVNALWEQLVQKDPPKDAPPKNPQAALLADDTEIIVTVDSRTGEVRQCGNYSGHCISANPWKADAAASPAALRKHAADLKREREEKEREEAREFRRQERSAAAAARRGGVTHVSNEAEPAN